MDPWLLPQSGLQVRGIVWALLVLLIVAPVRSDEEQNRFFENEIRPLLATRCFKCHGEKEHKNNLRLDSLAAAVAGGDNGPAIVPGKPTDSLILNAVKHESFEMPPDGKLRDEQIAALTRWIELGAPWPGSDPAAAVTVRKGASELTAEDRDWWAFQPVKSPAPPESPQGVAIHNDIDRFVAVRLQAEGLSYSTEAEKRTLIRRTTFDLHGLPPTSDEVAAFVADGSPQAYENLIDRLLESPRYGERWARHWLDLVRYAESDGYKQDDYRPTAWRYRDYVIAAFNADKPYDQFIKEQIAGDEVAPSDPQAHVATGYLQLGIYEYNQRDVPTQWNAILNELTDVTADVFLGQGLQCARCHDHKFDPLLQKDYYRLRAYFEAYTPVLSLPVATPQEKAEHAQRMADWEGKTAEIRCELQSLEEPLRRPIELAAIKKFPDDMRGILDRPRDELQPGEQQLYDLAFRQIVLETDRIDYAKKLQGEQLARWQALKSQLAQFDALKPPALPQAMGGSDIGSIAPPTVIPGKRNAELVEPGPLSVLDPGPAAIVPPHETKTTGRRKALAEWIASRQNPLTARVMVNRVWQYHFGRGLVSTSSDFGHLGDKPSHPELLDYLASQFVESGWSLKKLHRLIMTSAAYRQSSHSTAGATKDPSNRLLWRQNLRRLDAEQIRDAILVATGELKLEAGGPSVDSKEPRRTIYTKVFRNRRDPLLDLFDAPDGIASMPERNITTTPLQSLMLINNPWMLERSKVAATRIQNEIKGQAAAIDAAWLRVLGHAPSEAQRSAALEYVKNQDDHSTALADLCHTLLNSNEFLFVD